MIKKTENYPDWVCSPCGYKYGRKKPFIATWHNGKCGVCNKDAVVTEPRDFGHLDLNKVKRVKK